MSELRLETPREVECVTVVRVRAVRGRGIDNDPVRTVTQYWATDGVLLAESDPWERASSPQPCAHVVRNPGPGEDGRCVKCGEAIY